jgi:hypothetical protein
MSNSTGNESGSGADEQEYSGANFAFFALSFVTCIAIPYTLSLLRARSSRGPRSAAQSRADLHLRRLRRQARRRGRQTRQVDRAPTPSSGALCAALWLAWLAALVVVLTSAPSGAAAAGGFDPFKILEIESGCFRFRNQACLQEDERQMVSSALQSAARWRPC